MLALIHTPTRINQQKQDDRGALGQRGWEGGGLRGGRGGGGAGLFPGPAHVVRAFMYVCM